MSVLKLRQERAALVAEMRKALDAGDKSKWQTLDDKVEALGAKIMQADETRLLGLEADLATIHNPQRPPVGDPNGYAAESIRSTGPASTPEYRTAFEKYVRNGDPFALKELRDYAPLSSTGATSGETLIPTGFMRELELKMKSIGGLRLACRVIPTTTGNPLPWPRGDDTNNEGEILAESGPTSFLNPTFDSVLLGSSLVSSKTVVVPIQLLQDAGFSVESELSGMFGGRIGRTSNRNYTLGTDAIEGLIPALVAATGRNVAAVGAYLNTGVSGDTDINSLGTDDFANLIDKLDVAYRDGAQFMMNQATIDKLRTVKDKYGRLLWTTNLADKVPDSILGYKYFHNPAMDTIGAGKISVVFGQFAKYVVRDVVGMTMVRFNELFMQNHQVGFEAFLRTDGKLLQSAAFAYLQHPAS